MTVLTSNEYCLLLYTNIFVQGYCFYILSTVCYAAVLV